MSAHRFTLAELENMLDAVNAAASAPTDWQESAVEELGGEESPEGEAWLEESNAALESAAVKIKAMIAARRRSAFSEKGAA